MALLHSFGSQAEIATTPRHRQGFDKPSLHGVGTNLRVTDWIVTMGLLVMNRHQQAPAVRRFHGRLNVLLVGICVLFSLPTWALQGDVTGDAAVQTNDIICVARLVAGFSVEGGPCVDESAADLDCNGAVNTADITYVARQAVGMGFPTDKDMDGNNVHDACEGAIPAFPGAQGFGATTTGGRGGSVLIVDSLEDSVDNPGTGTLRWALNQSGPRTVIFHVGGTILLQDRLKILEPYVTVAGQTAPEPGITVGMDATSTLGKGPVLQVNTNDVVLRHMRLRRGTSKGAGDSLALYDGAERVMVDHVSITWGTDENFDIAALTPDATVRDLSIQHCLIAEGMWDQAKSSSGSSKGFLISGHQETESWRQVQNVAVHHNLMAHNTHRNPRVAAKGARIVNNVVYNWFTRVGSTFKDVLIDWDANVFKAGPMSTQSHVLFHATTDSKQTITYNLGAGYPDPSIFIEGNRVPGFTGDDPTALEADNWLMIHDHYVGGGISKTFRRTSPLPAAFHPIHRVDAGDSMTLHRLATVGANATVHCDGTFSLIRDTIDARIVKDVHTGTGVAKTSQIITSPALGGGYPTEETYSTCMDGDEDGLPLAWEDLNGLSDTDATDALADTDGDGYTALEEYLNGTAPNMADTQDNLVTLTLGPQSDGALFLAAAPHPVRCGSTCREWRVHPGQTITVVASPLTGDNPIYWTKGPCAGESTNSCRFTVTTDLLLDASSEPPPVYNQLKWKVEAVSTGSGVVTSSTTSASCGDQCIAVPEGDPVTVQAEADDGSVFVKWTWGKCTKSPNDPNTPECTIDPMPAAALIRAEFQLK